MVKLLVGEDGSAAVARLAETAEEIVSASMVYVEARSALARAVRDKRLWGARRRRARTELDRVWRELNAIEVDRRLIARAGDVAEQARLRAGDAIQLASALALDEPEVVFATWDVELARAALGAGLAVAP